MNLELRQNLDLSYLQGIGTKAMEQPPGERPLLCFLHGYDEAAPTGIQEGMTRHGPLRPGNPPFATEPFVVVAPQLPYGGDIWHRYADDVFQIVEKARHEYGADPTRTYLTGFSFGGNGVFDLALLQPERWAALWPVDPTRVPIRSPDRPIWLSFGAAARRSKGGFIGRLKLSEAGDPPVGDYLYLDQRQDHVGSARLAYADERIYRWLLEKRAHRP